MNAWYQCIDIYVYIYYIDINLANAEQVNLTNKQRRPVLKSICIYDNYKQCISIHLYTFEINYYYYKDIKNN